MALARSRVWEKSLIMIGATATTITPSSTSLQDGRSMLEQNGWHDNEKTHTPPQNLRTVVEACGGTIFDGALVGVYI